MMINFAIVGCGRIAPRHALAIRDNPETVLMMTCDIIGERARKLAADYEGHCWTSDYKKVLENASVDAVAICTPSGLHAEMGLAAARAGKHIMLEKPLALDYFDAVRLINFCIDSSTILSVVLQNRYNQTMSEAKWLMESNLLGRPLIGNTTVRWYRPQKYYEDDWHGTKEMSGGVLLNQACHHLDALTWLMGDVDLVYGCTRTLARKIEVPDTAIALVKFKNGAVGTIEASVLSYPENIEGSVTVIGTKGSIKVGGTHLNKREFWKVHNYIDLEQELLTQQSLDTSDIYGQGHQSQYADFVYLMNGQEPIVNTDGFEGLKSLQLALAINKSSETGKEVLIERE